MSAKGLPGKPGGKRVACDRENVQANLIEHRIAVVLAYVHIRTTKSILLPGARQAYELVLYAPDVFLTYSFS